MSLAQTHSEGVGRLPLCFNTYQKDCVCVCVCLRW